MRAHLTFALILLVSVPIELTNANAQLPGAGEPTANGSSADEMAELQKKAEAGDASAAYALAHAYETGKGVRQNLQLAAFWYRNAAERGNVAAQSSLGVLYWLGEGVDEDRKEAVKWYQKAARQGDANAMFNLGAAYYDGEGVNLDDTHALAWFLLASEAGCKPAQDAAKRSQAGSRPGTVCDAYLAVGEMYEKGQDLSRDLKQAEAWYRNALKKNQCGEARTHLIALFLNAGNYGDALEWCKEAARKRNPAGDLCLGHLYQQGLGVNQNLKAAFQWYERAANGGNTAGMFALGQMYENGQATKVNRPEAMFWLFWAARDGNREAVAEARRVRASMTEKEWKDARKKLAQKFDLKAVESVLQANNK